MRDIVLDERRCAGPKSARPCGVALGSPLDFVAAFVRGTTPHFTPLLANELPKAIAMYLNP